MPIKYLKNKGFGMIEVLITLVITATGLLGLASLQLNALKSNQFSYNRTQAVVLAYDMADRMRANSEAIDAKTYNQADRTVGSACSTSSGCSSTVMAKHDTYQWHQLLANTLPSGDGLVCIDSSPESTDTPASPGCDGVGDDYAIKIWWDDDRDGSIDTPFITSFQP